VDDDDSLTWVFKRLADSGQALALLVRYEGALNRSYDKAFKQLNLLQSTRNRPQPNEPKQDPRTPEPLGRPSRAPAPAAAPVAVTGDVASRIPAILTPVTDASASGETDLPSAHGTLTRPT